MSYDITIGDEHFNYTYNLSAFFRRFNARPADWDGKRTDELAIIIGDALRTIAEATEHSLIQYDPANGWGSWQAATNWLTGVMIACIENPGETVRAT